MPKKKPGTYTAKNGARYKILPNGRARFISGPKKRKKGGGMHKHGGGMHKHGGGMHKHGGGYGKEVMYS